MAHEIGFSLPPPNVSGGGGVVGHTGNMLRDFAKVLVPNGAIIGVVTFTQIELILKVTLLVLSVVYTTLHIILLWRKLKAKRLSDEPNI